MTNKELYQTTFSQVHASKTVDLEAVCRMKRKKGRGFRTVVTLAAAIAVLAALSTAAVAGNWFGLRELLLPEPQVLPAGPGGRTEPEVVDMISLQGWFDSPEARAQAEWQNFLNSYDQDGEIIAQIGNEPTGFEAEYGNYQVYTQEMANNLENIVEKYGLKLHQICNIISYQELTYRVGGAFLGEDHVRPWAYIYEDGTFQFDGAFRPVGAEEIIYQLRRTVKGSFDETTLNIRDVENYQEWRYETACGEEVLLALGPDKGLIFGDFPDCFMAVNVLAGADTASGGLTSAQLEKIADGIDFSVLKTVIEPDMRGDSVP